MVEDRMICIGDSVQLSFTGSGTFIWGPDSLLDNSSIVEPYAKPGESMYFTLTLTDDIGCFSKDSVFVDVFLPPVAYAGIDTVLNYDFDVLLSATLMASEQGEWTVESGSGKFDDIRLPGARVSSLSTGENRFKWSVDNGVCPVVSDEVIVFVNDLLIPTLITPNNDNRNDYFVLKGLENLGKTELVIFDKNGIMMFKTNNYNNDWNGVDSDGNPLQEDTYYFIIRSENGHSASGYLVIRR
jgi:gliding motility-associated-like protein